MIASLRNVRTSSLHPPYLRFPRRFRILQDLLIGLYLRENLFLHVFSHRLDVLVGHARLNLQLKIVFAGIDQ